jgi:hypothetical protein
MDLEWFRASRCDRDQNGSSLKLAVAADCALAHAIPLSGHANGTERMSAFGGKADNTFGVMAAMTLLRDASCLDCTETD